MQKHLRIAVFTIIVSSLFVFPGFSQGSQEDSFSERPSGNQKGPGRPEIPQPTEAELALLRLKVLIDEAQSQPELAVTADQAKALLPVLLDWDKAITSNPGAETDAYIEQISAELTDAQNAFIPGPPEGMPGESGDSGDKGAKGQRPPQGGPQKIEISSLLSDLIESLSL